MSMCPNCSAAPAAVARWAFHQQVIWTDPTGRLATHAGRGTPCARVGEPKSAALRLDDPARDGNHQRHDHDQQHSGCDQGCDQDVVAGPARQYASPQGIDCDRDDAGPQDRQDKCSSYPERAKRDRQGKSDART